MMVYFESVAKELSFNRKKGMQVGFPF